MQHHPHQLSSAGTTHLKPFRYYGYNNSIAPPQHLAPSTQHPAAKKRKKAVEGRCPMPVRIQALCLEGNSSIRGLLVGQLTWVSGKSHSED
jgi:hypothetical protein